MKIFVGWDPREAVAADVLEFSMRQNASRPIDVRFLKLDELSFNRPLDPLQSTEFTYSRFLVPYLCGFVGKALFMDSDMLVTGDICELSEYPMAGLALRVVKHDHRPAETTKMDGCQQTCYPRKNWSSLMLMDCSRLRIWTREFVETATGAQLHRFEGIPDSEIGDLPETWNFLDGPKCLHFTSGGPWFSECRDHPYAAVWRDWRVRMTNA